jgi:hypothetical protein
VWVDDLDEASIAMAVPDEVAGLLQGSVEVGAREQAFPFVTVDVNGFPHAALLSRVEMEVGPDHGDIRAALRSARTRANLERQGLALLIAVGGQTAHYVKLRLVRSEVTHDLLACVFEVVDHIADSLGIPLTPIGYTADAGIARAERWDLTGDALRALH